MSMRLGSIRRHFAWLLAASFGLALLAFSGGAQAQMQGGTIIWGKPNDVDSFDVHVSTNAVTWQVLFLVYESLVEPNEDLTGFDPLVAESWEQPSPTTYVFHIRENAMIFERPVRHGSGRRKQPESAAFAGHRVLLGNPARPDQRGRCGR